MCQMSVTYGMSKVYQLYEPSMHTHTYTLTLIMYTQVWLVVEILRMQRSLHWWM